jgi:type II secretory pathway component PulK
MVIILGVIGLAYTGSVRNQVQVSRLARGHKDAWWAAQAGIEKARVALAEIGTTPIADNDPLFDDKKTFSGQKVGRAGFSLIVPRTEQKAKQRYGLVDEASRVNINGADETMLMQLPNMTDELAQSLLDWCDADAAPHPLGAEEDYYQSLPEPRHPKNGPLRSMRELLLVRGWPQVLDAARPDPYTRFSDENRPASSMDPEDARALLESLTVWSADENLAPDGQKKMDLSSVDVATLKQRLSALSDLEAQSIVAHRTSGSYSAPLDLLSVMEAQAGASQQGQGGQPGGQNGQNGMPGGNPASQKPQKKAFELKRVAEIIDYFTVGDATKEKAGLVNINTAPREVLRAIPNVDENLATTIINSRRSNPIKTAGSIQGLNSMDENTFRQIYPKITTTSSRYHVTSRGFEPDSHAVVTLEAVLAVKESKVEIVYWREF